MTMLYRRNSIEQRFHSESRSANYTYSKIWTNDLQVVWIIIFFNLLDIVGRHFVVQILIKQL